MLLTLALSTIIGLLLGLLGGGGSILTVPMLVYVLGVAPKTAILTSFVVVGSSSLMAIVQHARRHSVCWKSGFFFGLAGMAGAYGGGRLAGYLSGEGLMALFGLVALATGVAMLRAKPAATDPGKPGFASLCPLKVPFPKMLFDGALVGLLTGLVGVGGGFLIVPALTLLVGLPMQAAIGTSLMIIAMNALAGIAGYAWHADLDLQLTAQVTAAAVVGALLGGRLSTGINAATLRRLFGLFVLGVAAYILAHALTAALLLEAREQLERHREFVLGMAFLSLVYLVYRLGVWIHTQGSRPALPPKSKA